ncbi:MAG TPA: hypothetical protein VK893_07870, partial [Pyrinomonadaceae bacterium]|nr:hypothetical protein [Pyrinomonadaceae bacterium]
MHKRPLVSGVWLALLIFVFASLAAAQNGAPEIAFTVAMPRPHTHLFEIEIAIKRGPTVSVPAQEQLIMPVWTPGSYLIREFQRHVKDFAVTDSAGKS